MNWLVGILRMDWFSGRHARRNWTIVLSVLAFSMLSIWLAHLGEQKARELKKLKSENRQLRAEYVESKKLLMHDQLRSSVYDKLAGRGFVIPKRPPHRVQIVEE